MSATRIPVLDVGGTHVTAALVEDARVHLARTRALDADADADADAIVDVIAATADELAVPNDESWAVAMPGPFDYAAGRGTFEGVGKFGGLAGVDLGQRLAERLGTVRDRVVFVNDADAYALGEWGAQGRPDRLCCVTLGTGVGAGFVEGGGILTDDPRVPAGGDLYHQRWRGDALEDHVSRRALVRAYGVPGLDVADIARRGTAGEPAAVAVFDHAMSVLADVLSPWMDAFRPAALVVGGAIAGSWDLVGPPLDAALRRAGVPSVDVKSSVLSQDAPLIGAAELVRSAHGSVERRTRR
jgi:glucokinase